MKIYKLTVDWESIFPNSKITGNGHWDSFYGKVIRAKSEKSARKIANENIGDEGKIWENPTNVKCEIITCNGNIEEVIMEDFHAG